MAANAKAAPNPQLAGGCGESGAEAGETGPALLAQLGEERDAHPAGDEPGGERGASNRWGWRATRR